MYLGEKSIVCATFNVCLICRASIELRVCLSFMSWRKQSGFYLREKHFKDLSICYQVKLNRQLNAVYSSCSNIFPLHTYGSEHVRMCKRNWSPYIRSSSPMHSVWMVGFRRGAFIRESRAFTGNRSGRYTLRSGSPLLPGFSAAQVNMNELSTVDVLEKGSCIWIFEFLTPTPLATKSNY